jgi:hypothetical protein
MGTIVGGTIIVVVVIVGNGGGGGSEGVEIWVDAFIMCVVCVCVRTFPVGRRSATCAVASTETRMRVCTPVSNAAGNVCVAMTLCSKIVSVWQLIPWVIIGIGIGIIITSVCVPSVVSWGLVCVSIGLHCASVCIIALFDTIGGGSKGNGSGTGDSDVLALGGDAKEAKAPRPLWKKPSGVVESRVGDKGEFARKRVGERGGEFGARNTREGESGEFTGRVTAVVLLVASRRSGEEGADEVEEGKKW